MKNETGRSMVEMLGVLAIIGVLSVGGISGYSKAMYRLKMNKTIEIFNRVLNDFVELTSRNLGDDENLEFFSSDSNANIGLADYLDSLSEICNDREYDVNGWQACRLPIGSIYGGFATYYSNPVYQPFRGEFIIDFGDYHNKVQACVDFASYDWTHVIPQEWFTKYSGTMSITYGDDIYYYYRPYMGKTSYTLAEIAEACGKCGSSERCEFYIDFSGGW